jgi:hypothetical protein
MPNPNPKCMPAGFDYIDTSPGSFFQLTDFVRHFNSCTPLDRAMASSAIAHWPCSMAMFHAASNCQLFVCTAVWRHGLQNLLVTDSACTTMGRGCLPTCRLARAHSPSSAQASFLLLCCSQLQLARWPRPEACPGRQIAAVKTEVCSWVLAADVVHGTMRARLMCQTTISKRRGTVAPAASPCCNGSQTTMHAGLVHPRAWEASVLAGE